MQTELHKMLYPFYTAGPYVGGAGQAKTPYTVFPPRLEKYVGNRFKNGLLSENFSPPGVPRWLRACYTAKKIPHESTCSVRIFWNVFRSSCIRVCEKIVDYFLSSFSSFCWIGYHAISLLLWTADNWVGIGLELSTTTFAVLTLACNLTSLLKI